MDDPCPYCGSTDHLYEEECQLTETNIYNIKVDQSKEG